MAPRSHLSMTPSPSLTHKRPRDCSLVPCVHGTKRQSCRFGVTNMSNNAFLVRLSISAATFRKLDKNATAKARADAGAEAKAGVKVYKSALATEALAKIQQI